jgi:hypothetical protein
MENPLLEAIKVNKEKGMPLNSYIQCHTNEDILAHILDLLQRQREKCAENAVAKSEEDLLGGEWLSVNQDSILNAKLF